MSHMGRTHIFSVRVGSGTTIGECFIEIARKLAEDIADVHIMDVSSVPWQWSPGDDDSVAHDRVVHVRSIVRGG